MYLHTRVHTHTYSGERDSVDLENLERADAFSLPCSLGKRVKDKFGSYDRFRNDLFAARFEYLRGTISFRIYFSRYVIGISQRHIKYLFRLIPRPRLTRNGRYTENEFPKSRLFLFRHIARQGSNYRDEINIKIKFNVCTRNKSNFLSPLFYYAPVISALFFFLSFFFFIFPSCFFPVSRICFLIQ